MTKPRKWATVLAVVIAFYTVLGFFVLPAIIKSQILKKLPALAHRNVAIQQVRLNPYALSFTIRGFALTEPNGDPFASFDEFYVNLQLWASLFKRALVFREIRLSKPSGSIVWKADGTLNFSNMLATSPSEPSEKKKMPGLVIELIVIDAGELTFTDFTRPHPFRQDYRPINLRLTNLSTLPQHNSPYSFVAITPAGGTFEWTGDASINPPRSTGRFKLTGSALKTYSPYVQVFAGLAIRDGVLGMQADYRFDYSTGQLELDIRNASLQLNNLKLDSDDHATAISFDQLAISGIEASVANEMLRIANLSLANIRGGVRVGATGRVVVEDLGLAAKDISVDRRAGNLDVAEVKLTGGESGMVLASGRSASEAAVAKSSSESFFQAAAEAFRSLVKLVAKPLAAKVGAVTLDNVGLRFTDESITPPAVASIDELSGRLAGLAWDTNTLAQVAITGKANGTAPLTLNGKLNPAAALATLDLAFSLRDNPLTPVSPYMSKYVGYPIEKGALSLDLHYYVTERELKSENKVRVDQLTLGAASGSPHATTLPVKLGIALLQDRHGVIALDVPVNGRLDDPKFKLGPLIMQVFMNIITKAMTKPFALLGSLFGGGEDLDRINFDLGTAQFAAGETGKLDSLATALYERPALTLGITGSVDPVKDRAALAKIRLDAKLGGMRAKELEAAGQKVTSVDSVRLTPDDRERLVKLAYAEAMGLVSSRASATRTETVIAHLTTKTNFEPLHKVESPLQAKQGASATPTAALTPADMEAKLIELTVITPDDFKKLMNERTAAVQSYLLQSGKVTIERLTLVEPKPVDASFQGSSRVNLSLQ